MTVQTAFRLKKSLVDKLKKYCEKEGRSQTWVANKAFSDYLGLTPKEPTGIISVSEKKPAAKQVAVVHNYEADIGIDTLNQRAGTKYRYTATNRKLINARLKDYSLMDICYVIEKKCSEWLGGEMARYLRPSTLFNATKFEEYLNQDIQPDKPRGRTIDHDSTRTRDQSVVKQLTDKTWAN
jgi:uncharacterized phage protein (TIGR02220 family)